MFGIGTQEILIVLALAVIIIGPKKLPEVASALGKSFADFKRSFDDLKQTATIDFKTTLEKERIIKENPHLEKTPEEAETQASAPADGTDLKRPEKSDDIPDDGSSADPPDTTEEEEYSSYDPEEIES